MHSTGSTDPEVRIVELNWRKTVDAVDVERVIFATQLVHDGGDERELSKTEVGVHVVGRRHVECLLICVGLLAEVDDGGVVCVD